MIKYAHPSDSVHQYPYINSIFTTTWKSAYMRKPVWTSR